MQTCLFGIVVKVALDQHDGSALVAAAGGQVAQGTDQVGEPPGRSALRDHLAGEVAVLVADIIGDRLLEGVAGEVGKVIERGPLFEHFYRKADLSFLESLDTQGFPLFML